MNLYPKGSAIRDGMKSYHFTLGMIVLGLVFLRIGVRAFSSPPPIVPAPTAFHQFLSGAMHAVLYVFMIGMPVGGWIILSAAGKPIPFGLPPLVAESKDFANLVKEVHELGGNLGYVLVGLHAVAALFHHYVLRDNTLRRMMPGRAA